MEVQHHIIDCLEKTPGILKNLLSQISEDLYKVRRVDNKWCIHEQVCHLVEAQKILKERFRKFETKENPLIESYNPPVNRVDNYYMNLDMKEELKKFPIIRSEMINLLRSYDSDYWELSGRHKCFHPYNTQILLTHSLNVDYAHLFSIEQLGLTKSECKEGIITIP